MSSMSAQDSAAPALQDRTETQALTSGLSRELEERYQMCVKRLKQQLETEQRLAAKMRSVSDRQFGDPSDLEDFFLQCIDQVKLQISDRKKSTVEYNQKIAGKKEGSAPTIPKRGKVPGAPISIDDFTVVDRRKVVELLLSSEQVLQFLYDKLFPPVNGMPAIQD